MYEEYLNDSVKDLAGVADRILQNVKTGTITNTYLFALLAIAYRNLGSQEKYQALESRILKNLREEGYLDHSEMTITCTPNVAVLSF